MNASMRGAGTRDAPACSVVIPTYRRPEGLAHCLDALLGQSLPTALFEIVVVDDARSDATEQQVTALARARGGRPRIRYLRPAPGSRGPAAARNAGWRAAMAPVIAFTDDDALPSPHWLVEGLRALAAPDVDAAAGRVVVPLPAVPTDGERNSAGLDGAEFVTANCFVRRAALREAGGFDERFTRPWREDSDLYFTLLERGSRVVSAPAALVLHPPRRVAARDNLNAHRNLLFDALLYKKHPRLYRAKIKAVPPLSYYAAVAAAAFAVAALLAGNLGTAGGAAAAWGALTVTLTARRQRGCPSTWAHLRDMFVTSAAIPFLAVFWRLSGALRFRVPFL
ncbi:MAG: glycosyltransferase family 2 protein [Ignavibacteria bacterium]